MRKMNRYFKDGKVFVILAVILLIYVFTGTAAFAYVISTNPDNGVAGKWEPGANTASSFNPGAGFQNGPGTPGGATWSIMAPGIFITNADVDNPGTPSSIDVNGNIIGLEGFHSFGDQSSNIGDLVIGAAAGYEISVIGQALDIWAAESGFTNLGMVADGGDWNGQSNANGGHLGDIRIGAYPFVLVGGEVINAHSLFHPLTNAQGPEGSTGGDIHFNNTNQVQWIDDAFDTSGDIDYDFFTVALHEIGHSLGLAHSDDSTSVMALYNTRGIAQRTLQPDDIAGIQAIYGSSYNGGNGGDGGSESVPEPATIFLLSTGLVGIAGFRFKNKFRKN